MANQQNNEAIIAEARALDGGTSRGAEQLRDIQAGTTRSGTSPGTRYDPRQSDAGGRAARPGGRRRGVARGEVESNPLLDQLRDTVAKAETQLKKTTAGGDASKIAEAEAAVAARREWLAEAERSVRR